MSLSPITALAIKPYKLTNQVNYGDGISDFFHNFVVSFEYEPKRYYDILFIFR